MEAGPSRLVVDEVGFCVRESVCAQVTPVPSRAPRALSRVPSKQTGFWSEFLFLTSLHNELRRKRALFCFDIRLNTAAYLKLLLRFKIEKCVLYWENRLCYLKPLSRMINFFQIEKC